MVVLKKTRGAMLHLKGEAARKPCALPCMVHMHMQVMASVIRIASGQSFKPHCLESGTAVWTEEKHI